MCTALCLHLLLYDLTDDDDDDDDHDDDDDDHHVCPGPYSSECNEATTCIKNDHPTLCLCIITSTCHYGR